MSEPSLAYRKAWVTKKLEMTEEEYAKSSIETDSRILHSKSAEERNIYLDSKTVEMYSYDLIVCQCMILLGMYSIVEKDSLTTDENIPNSRICREVRRMNFSKRRMIAFEKYHVLLLKKESDVRTLIDKKAASIGCTLTWKSSGLPDLFSGEPIESNSSTTLTKKDASHGTK